ncbi:MAG: ABC transporter permease [Deltaproteobacteria bacterium]|nr:ABC transporter permease [Deltaproteobacteria bacterium]MBW2047924.1 ABC transporter permease [Deltaproteobacteria bacterium]MBW2113004.1 ABC transporter permease [Deltaproteobacteria bacterium]MBW2352970.1 ABC transporter permease [Deltaproteobacteria bacterium]
MQGLYAVFRKELQDHLSSYRFVILFALISMVSFITSYMAAVHMRENLEALASTRFPFLMLFSTPGAVFSMVQFVAFFGPLIGLILGFDAINRERAQGTLIKVISQPIYRDAVINGKFLAGVATITLMLVAIVLVISGFGLALVGVVPGIEEIWRLFIYLVISIFYISFWLGLSILFSILFRSIATSALASVALWIFLSFFVSLGAEVVANAVAPIDRQDEVRPEAVLENAQVKGMVSLTSPMVLYTDATATIIDPMRKTTRSIILMGPMEELLSARFQNPLSLGQSIIIVLPHIMALMAITLICFSVSYLVFMLQEVRT